MSTVLEAEVVSSIPVVLPVALTIRQKSFIHHFIATRNATKSAELAGYTGSYETLKQTGSENLAKPYIRAEITRLLNPIADAEEIVARLTKYSRSSIADVLDGSGEFDIEYAKANLSDDLIKKLKIKRRIIPVKDGEPETEITHEIELHDAKDATIQLAKIHKLMDASSVELSLTDADADRIGQQVVASLLEAAARRREQQQQQQLEAGGQPISESLASTASKE